MTRARQSAPEAPDLFATPMEPSDATCASTAPLTAAAALAPFAAAYRLHCAHKDTALLVRGITVGDLKRAAEAVEAIERKVE